MSLSTESRRNNTTENSRTYAAGPCRYQKLFPWEEVSTMNGNVVLALVSTGSAVLNDIGILMTWMIDSVEPHGDPWSG